MSGEQGFDVQHFLDERRFSPIHAVIVGLCTALMMIDGFDVYIVGKLAPAIADRLGAPATGMTPVFIAQQAGLAAGAFLVGPLADRFGRRRMLIACAAAFGLLTLACMLATSVVQFALLRGLAGLFLSGVIPNVVALLTEIAPRGARARFVTIAFAGFSMGAAAGAVATAALLVNYGWQSAFWIGGLLPLVLLPLLVFVLPESVQYRVNRNPRDPRIGATLRRFDRRLAFPPGQLFTLPAGPAARGNPVRAFLASELSAKTVLLWLTFFIALGNLALLASWMPTFFRELEGISLQHFALTSLWYYLGGGIGTIGAGFFVDRFGARRALVPFFLLNGAALVAIGQLDFGTPLFILAIFAWGFFQSGGQGGINALAGSLYPSRIRSTGVGLAFGMGRLGGIAGPLLGGLILASASNVEMVFLLVALPSLAAAAVLSLMPAGAGRRGEEA